MTTRRRPRPGRFRRWSAAQLIAVSTVDDQARADARALWRRFAPPALRDLLDAQVDRPEARR